MIQHQVTNARGTTSPEVKGYQPRALERVEIENKTKTEQQQQEEKEKEELEDLNDSSIDQFFSPEWIK